MSNLTKQLKCGHFVDDTYDQENLDFTGSVSDITKLDETSYEAEINNIYRGSLFYYYFAEETLKYIVDGEPPKAKARDKCPECLYKSVTHNQNPHYGDGVYFSQHEDLFSDYTHPEVILSHGIEFRKNKATYLCNDHNNFRKIPRTGGVLRSCVHNREKELISIDNGVLLHLDISKEG